MPAYMKNNLWERERYGKEMGVGKRCGNRTEKAFLCKTLLGSRIRQILGSANVEKKCKGPYLQLLKKHENKTKCDLANCTIGHSLAYDNFTGLTETPNTVTIKSQHCAAPLAGPWVGFVTVYCLGCKSTKHISGQSTV